VLRLDHISKGFPGVQALSDVSVRVERGQVLALCGENGAGKSTLMKILSGIYRADEGRILLDDQEVTIASPHHAQLLGVVIIHQELNLMPNLTVAENIYIGHMPRRFTMVDTARLRRDARALLESLGVDLPVDSPIRDLSIAQQQMVEIAKALSYPSSRVIIMDEPTSSLTDRETVILFDLIRRLKEQGLAIIFISHRMDEVFEIADTIAVLRDGQLVVQWSSASDTNRALVTQAMVGRPLADLFQKQEAVVGEVVLEVRGLSKRPTSEAGMSGRLDNISLVLRCGEILGLAGLVGAGRTELARALFGIDRYDQGEIILAGQPVRIESPHLAIRLGLGFVPEDRKQQALILNMAVGENTTLAGLQRFSTLGWINSERERVEVTRLINSLHIRPPHMDEQVVNLSGGNQQKVVLARWLTLKPRILLLDEPTRGVDVGAKAEIHGLISELAQQGTAILVISSELPEVLGLADRIAVMARGRIVANFSRAEATQERIMVAATAGEGVRV